MLNDDVMVSAALPGALQPTNTLKARILVADDHSLIAEALSMLLAPHFDVVGVLNDASLIAEELLRLQPAVVLLHITMRGFSGLDAARIISKEAPDTKIVFLTMHANRVIMREAFRVGASAFVVKNCAAKDLVQAVKTVLNGATYVSPEVQNDVASHPLAKLSDREIAVLQLVAQCCSAKEIGFQLNISPRTAEFHKGSIMKKLDLGTVGQLTRYAIEHGLAL
ncbi:MAG: response regulator transcription factor [Bryobacteraceae bacterium]